MSDIKISQLTELTSASDSDVLVINDVSALTTKTITVSNLLADTPKNLYDSADGIRVSGDLKVDNDIVLDGDVFTTGKITFGSLEDYANNLFISKIVSASDTIINNLTDSSIPTSAAVGGYLDTVIPVIVDSAVAQYLNGLDSAQLTSLFGSVDSEGVLVVLENGVRDIIPELDSTYDLGSSSKKWKDLYLSGSTIYIADKQIQSQSTLINFQNADGIAFNGIRARFGLDSAAVLSLQASYNGLDSAGILAFVDSAVANATFTLTSRVDADSDRLTSIASQVTELQSVVTGGGSYGLDSAGVISLIDSARAELRSEYYTLIDLTNDSVSIQAGRIDTLSANLSLLDGSVTANASAISGLVTRVDLDSARLTILSQDVTSLSASLSSIQASGVDSDLLIALVDSAVANANSGLIARIDADSSRLDVLTSDFTSLSSSVVLTSNFNTTLTNSTAFQNLSTRVSLDSDRLDTVSSAVTTIQSDYVTSSGLSGAVTTAVATATSSLTTRINADSDRLDTVSSAVTTIQSNYVSSGDLNTAVTNAVSTATSSLTTRINADSDRLDTVSSAVTAIQSDYVTSSGLSGAVTTAVSSATSELTTRINADSDRLDTVSSAVTTIQSNYVTTSALTGEVTTAVATATSGLETDITALDSAVTDIKARFFVTTNVNGHVSGISLYNGGDTSEFSIVADNFNVINASNNAIQPFSVSGDTVFMSNVEARSINVSTTTTNQGKTLIGNDTITIQSWNGSSYVTRVKIGNLA